MKFERGFTLVEMLVVITIIGILAAIAIPNMTKARIKAREGEVKANLHVIQEAIERYYVDEHEYPPYLVGGNENSWPVFYNRGGDANFKDALLDRNYIDSYPKNVFVDEDKGGEYLKATGGSVTVPASGDPRFGVKGTVMPNSVDDPLIFLAPGGVAETINTAGTYLIQNYFNYGGHILGSGQPSVDIIQGSFFYRAVGDIDMFQSTPQSNPTRRDFVYSNYSGYILGGFGSDTTKGIDVLRLEGTGTYSKWPSGNWTFDVPVLLPEVFGGGDAANNPYFPYEPAEDGVPFPFGAPDGLPDGVILVMTSSGTSINF